ncbi:MAG: hypothetical protein RL642_296 [Bacteroidota bacterium]|jgi:hypothetical protein
MKARSAKAKGTRLEVLIAKRLRDAGLDKEARRMVLSGGAEGFESDIRTSLPLSIEAKNQETWKPLEYMEQAQESANKTNKMPVVIMSKNRLTEPLVMMRLDDFVLILQRAFLENSTPLVTGSQAYTKHNQLKGR